MTDDELVQLAKNGRSEAVGELYERYVEPVYRFCYWQVNKRREDAEDLTAEVFVEMSKSIRNFRGEASFKNWLYAIAKNRINKWLKRRYQLPEVTLFEIMAEEEEWVDEKKQKRKVKRLKQILGRLNQRERKIVVMRYLENASVAEVSEMLGMSESNVKVVAHRAMGKLRKMGRNRN